jgi:hypothetical protein
MIMLPLLLSRLLLLDRNFDGELRLVADFAALFNANVSSAVRYFPAFAFF